MYVHKRDIIIDHIIILMCSRMTFLHLVGKMSSGLSKKTGARKIDSSDVFKFIENMHQHWKRFLLSFQSGFLHIFCIACMWCNSSTIINNKEIDSKPFVARVFRVHFEAVYVWVKNDWTWVHVHESIFSEVLPHYCFIFLANKSINEM